MKFKCVNNDGMEHRLKLGKVYEGEYVFDQRDELGKPHVKIQKDEDTLPTTYMNFRFQLVLEAC